MLSTRNRIVICFTLQGMENTELDSCPSGSQVSKPSLFSLNGDVNVSQVEVAPSVQMHEKTFSVLYFVRIFIVEIKLQMTTKDGCPMGPSNPTGGLAGQHDCTSRVNCSK